MWQEAAAARRQHAAQKLREEMRGAEVEVEQGRRAEVAVAHAARQASKQMAEERRADAQVAAVASLFGGRFVLTEIYLCGVCSGQEILRRNGRGQTQRRAAVETQAAERRRVREQLEEVSEPHHY
eukprot:COSAG01_NODE_4428_length_5032_cov_11.671666_3_plen_125_part_00